MNRPKKIGTAAETATVQALRRHGFPHAERRALTGTHDQGDITGTPGICWEVKGGTAAKTASDRQVAEWLTETERERIASSSDIGVLVLARAGIGPANAERWWAVVDLAVIMNAHPWAQGQCLPYNIPIRMRLGELCGVLQAAGYGSPEADL